MKRRWRAGWIVLGVMLFGIAGLVYANWPVQPCWRIPEERVIGFDEAKKLLYVVVLTGKNYELRGYDISSGVRQKTVLLTPITNKTHSNVIEIDIENPGTLQSDDNEESHKHWKWVLSPNKQVLLAINGRQNNFQLFDLESGQLLRRIPFPKRFPIDLTIEIGFSDDGKLFAMRDVSDKVAVWDLNSRMIIEWLDPSHDVSMAGYFKILLNQLHANSRCGFLTYSDPKQSILRDMTSKVDLIKHPAANSIPRILDDGKLVVFAPERIDASNRPAWYRRQVDGEWKQLPLDLDNGSRECRFVCYASDMVVTDTAVEVHSDRSSWMPESLWKWGMQVFPLLGTRHYLQFWDLHTGTIRREFNWFEPVNNHGYFSTDLEDRVVISENGNWLAQRYEGQLTVWDLTGRRTLLCWIVTGGILAFAQWLAWPRRMKAAT